MDRLDNMQAKVRVHAVTNWFEFYGSQLYKIEHSLWMKQNNLADLSADVRKMRSELPANVGAYLGGDNNQTHHTHTGTTMDHDHSHGQRIDFSGNSESNGLVSELMEASASDLNEIAAPVAEHRRSTASDTNAPDTNLGACGVAGCVAYIQQLQSAVSTGPSKRAGLAKGRPGKQRIGLRRSPRLHRQR
jgi:hypothetical protein